MPVFQETSSSHRDLRILPSLAPPLPRLTPTPEHLIGAKTEKYEVVVIGAGPAGLFLTLNLSRLGLSDSSLLCVDAKPGTLKAGQADGLQPRTLEVLKSLGVVDEILNEGCWMSEVAFWNPKQDASGQGIERTSFVPDVACPARYQHEVTIHQGRIERILEENLRLYSQRSIVRSTRFVDFHIDAAGDAEFPVVVELEQDQVALDGRKKTTRKTVRTKYLVGADGAHSQVRRAMNLKLEGETTDHIWGVVDFVADTNFPDVRKRCAIHSKAGSIMIIPRERINSGEYLTRLYVQVKEEVTPDPETAKTNGDVQEEEGVDQLKKSRQRRAAITQEYIFEQAQRVLSPYYIHVKKGTVVDWWAAYQIGQRMTPQFIMKDSNCMERVFIVGDACHTHSPKAGQGMNVSMMDSYNLAWKLVHNIHGLTPAHEERGSDPIVASFEHERLTVARQLIDFDSKFSSMFSGEIGAGNGVAEGLTHEQFLKVFSDGNGFTSGCGIEYPAGRLVDKTESSFAVNYPVRGDDFLSGVWRPGRRLLNVQVRRFADANLRNLQDDFLSTGRYRILVLASTDLRQKDGQSALALEKIGKCIMPSFPKDLIELVVVHPLETQRFEWTEIPSVVREFAEMRFHGACVDDAYGIYGIDCEKGAAAVVRPDGYIGAISALEDVESLERYLRGCLVTTAA